MKETKTVQVYPSDNIVNETIEEYESFGWEVIGNQRCQEFDGQTYENGSRVNNYSTFNKITFTREKNSAWYEKVSQLENEYFSIQDTVKLYRNREPVLKRLTPHGDLAFCLYVWAIVPGLIYSIVRCCLKSKFKKQYKKALTEYNAVYPAKIKELNNKLAELRMNAEKCISEKA